MPEGVRPLPTVHPGRTRSPLMAGLAHRLAELSTGCSRSEMGSGRSASAVRLGDPRAGRYNALGSGGGTGCSAPRWNWPQVHYVRRPFERTGVTVDFNGASVSFYFADLLKRAEDPR